MKARIYFVDGRRGDIVLDEATWERAQHDLAQFRRDGAPGVRTYPGLDGSAAGGPICWTLTFGEIVSIRRVRRPDLGGLAWGLYRHFRRHFRVLRSFLRCACGRSPETRSGRRVGAHPLA